MDIGDWTVTELNRTELPADPNDVLSLVTHWIEFEFHYNPTGFKMRRAISFIERPKILDPGDVLAFLTSHVVVLKRDFVDLVF